MLDQNDLRAIAALLNPIREEITGLKENVAGLDQKVNGLDQKVTGIEQNVAGLDQKVNGLDQKVSGLDQKVNALEQSQREMKQDLTNIKLTLENETNKKINLMYESHQVIIKKLEKIDEIDPMKEQLADVQRAIIVHTRQITELQKAQA